MWAVGILFIVLIVMFVLGGVYVSELTNRLAAAEEKLDEYDSVSDLMVKLRDAKNELLEILDKNRLQDKHLAELDAELLVVKSRLTR